MSIVAVHGPYTFGSRAVAKGAGPTLATVDPTNGLIWTFKVSPLSTRPDQDFSWAFPTDGTPTPQVLENPAPVTYATPGSKTATLTVINQARTVSNKALTANVATLTTTATHGFAVGQSVVVSGVGVPFDGTFVIASTPSGTTFTYACTAANVTSAASGGTVTSDPAQTPTAGTYQIVVPAVSGTGGAGASLRSVEGGDGGDGGFDPFDHTVAEVEDYVTEHPDEAQSILDAELAGKDRVTLVNFLENLLA
jgi:hypothetical protein